jgi:hypothetical protein
MDDPTNGLDAIPAVAGGDELASRGRTPVRACYPSPSTELLWRRDASIDAGVPREPVVSLHVGRAHGTA